MEAKTTPRRGVLVLDGDTEHRNWTAGVLRGVEPSARAAERIASRSDLASYDLIVANYDSMHGRDRRLLFQAIDQNGRAGPHLLIVSSAAGESSALFHELEQHQLTNLLALDRDVSSQELQVTARKLLEGEIFGLGAYLGSNVERFAAELRSSAAIETAVDGATQFASDLGVHPRLVENAATAVDELVTNALYNAPVDDEGNPRFAHLPRTTPVELEPDEKVELVLCSDGDTLGISVSDCFGALTKEQSLSYLVSCIRGADEQPTRDKGGAGLGLYMTFDALNHLVLNICANRRTEVIGLIDIRGSYRDFVSRGKSFNIFLCDHDTD